MKPKLEDGINPVRIYSDISSKYEDYVKRDVEVKFLHIRLWSNEDLEIDDPNDFMEADYEIERLNLVSAYVQIPSNNKINKCLINIYWNDNEGNWKIHSAPLFDDIKNNYFGYPLSDDNKEFQDKLANGFGISHIKV